MIIAIIPMILFTGYGCHPKTGYPIKTIKKKYHFRPYNHARDGHKKKTRVYWMKAM